MIDLKKLIKSFGFALRGVNELLRTEQNARIHLSMTFLVFLMAIIFRVNHLEAAIIFMAVIMVFALEIINTAIEKMLDLVHPESHEVVRKVKDGLAGAVLIAATIATVAAILVFYPHIRALFY